MLSWVWHGVCTPLIEMLPSLKTSSCWGVLVTPSQSLPPMISSLGVPSSASCEDSVLLLRRQISNPYQLLVSASVISVAAGC